LLGEVSSSIPTGTKFVLKKSMNNVAELCEVISQSRNQESDAPVTWVNGNVSLHEKALHNLISELTDTQIQTLRLVADGLTNAEISRVRYVSEKSVEQIVSRIALVLNVQPDRSKNMRVQLVGEYFRWIGAPRH
jgi:DNA-binding NarL/FixJ family response regulator